MLYMQLHSKELTAARLYRSLWLPNFTYSAIKAASAALTVPVLSFFYYTHPTVASVLYYCTFTVPLLSQTMLHSLYCTCVTTLTAFLVRRCQSCLYCTRCKRGRQNIISLTLQKQIYTTSTVQRLPPELHNPFWTEAAKIKSHTVANVDRATLIVPMLPELYYTSSVGIARDLLTR